MANREMATHCAGNLFIFLQATPQFSVGSTTPRTRRPKTALQLSARPWATNTHTSHRSMRHMADHLAEYGIASLRFDYRGTGDSPGSDADADRVNGWQRDIEAAIDYAKHATGCTVVCVIGIRLGATLAALVAQRCTIDLLVLWNPCINGRRYLREMQAIAASAATPRGEQNGVMESAGFAMTKDTAAAIGKIDLLANDFSVNARTLIVNRDDLGTDPRLPEKLQAAGVNVDQLTVPGYADMMAEPQFTVVPHQAIDHIGQWLLQLTQNTNKPVNSPVAPTATINFDTPDLSGNIIKLTEQLCQFGSSEQLFGILSFLHTRASDRTNNCSAQLRLGSSRRAQSTLCDACTCSLDFGIYLFPLDLRRVGR